MDWKSSAPAKWQNHWAAMPNSVDQLYAWIWCWFWPFFPLRFRVEAWGQLCFDGAAANATAYMMWNSGIMRYGCYYIGWHCKMSGPLVGGAKRNGWRPRSFKIRNYVR